VLPADRASGFAEEAARILGGGLVRCDERFPEEGAHSVLCVVVERDAAQWRERLAALHAKYFAPPDPLAPVRLEVLDCATHDALERLVAAGLFAASTRVSRPLRDAGSVGVSPPPLSAEEKARIAAHRQQGGRRLKMARLLNDGGLSEEADGPLREAMLACARALAIENRLPEPVDVEGAVRPPLSHCWQTALEPLRRSLGDPGAIRAAIEALAPLLELHGASPQHRVA
jgi:hypothetical protein